MIAAAQPLPPSSPASPAANAPEGWEALRASADIQFAPVPLPPPAPPRELGLFERLLQAFFEWLGRVLGPVGEWLGNWWGIIGWGLLILVAGFVIYGLVRAFGPLARRRPRAAKETPAWQPERAASLALIEEAEQLAAEGRFDEATHLLLTRSVGELSAARPGLVEPSSTARELAVLPALSEPARTAFGVMAQAVERSLFALQSLERADWEAARDAYARFALALPQHGGEVAAA